MFFAINSQTQHYIARLNGDGALDTTFNPGADAMVFTLALQPDGKLLAGGAFVTIDGQARNHLARLHADGTLEATFNPNVDGSVYTLALQPNGALMLGGAFNSIGGQTRFRIARLNADGDVDTEFNPSADGIVIALALQSDGKLVVGGDFNTMGGQPRNRIARLSTLQAALQSLNILDYTAGGSAITWARAGAGPELALPPKVLFSLDGANFAPTGTMKRIGNGWQHIGFVPPLSGIFYLRTQGQVSSGNGNGSSGLIESTRKFYLNGNDGIFIDGFE